MSRKWFAPALFILCVFALGIAIGGALMYSVALYRDGTLAVSGNRFVGEIVGSLLIAIFGIASVWMFLRSIINTSIKKVEIKIPWFIGFGLSAVAAFVAAEVTINQWFGADIRSRPSLRSFVPPENLYVTGGFAGMMYLVLAVFFVIIAGTLVVMLMRCSSKPKSGKTHSGLPSTSTARPGRGVDDDVAVRSEPQKVHADV